MGRIIETYCGFAQEGMWQRQGDLRALFGTGHHKTGKELERVKRIELSSSAWEAAALPLSYTRLRAVLQARTVVQEMPR